MTRRRTTTDSAGPSRRRGFSVRSRITLAIAALTALAMLMVGFILQALGAASMTRDEAGDVRREFEEFRTLQNEGVDPETGRPFTARSLLQRFLVRNVPDDDELTVSYLRGRPVEYSAGGQRGEVGDWQTWISSPGYRSAVDRVLDRGGRTTFEDDTYGEVWVSALPIRMRGQQQSGNGLVIVTFLDDERAEVRRTLQFYGSASIAVLALATLLAWVVAGRLLAPIRLLRSTTEEIGASDLSGRIPERGNDDLTDLTHAVNSMLDRLEEGFEAQRRFLDDAGHELRTPLTVVGGHLELMDPDEPDDVRETRDLVIDETDRMSRLVSDLILLAKSRRLDFVAPHPTDLPELAESLGAKVTALGDRDWRVENDVSGTAYLDAQRITQAVLQLADNAVKHTDPGQPIVTGSSRTAGTVSFWIRDTGDGIRPEDMERIFDRFGRSTVRSGDEGFGLGLSIVHAIVRAHRGTVTVESALGAGTTMTISLPTEEEPWPTS